MRRTALLIAALAARLAGGQVANGPAGSLRATSTLLLRVGNGSAGVFE